MQRVAREITLRDDADRRRVVAAVKDARSAEMLGATDDKGGRIIVPSASIGYVTTEQSARPGLASASTEGASRDFAGPSVRFASRDTRLQPK